MLPRQPRAERRPQLARQDLPKSAGLEVVVAGPVLQERQA